MRGKRDGVSSGTSLEERKERGTRSTSAVRALAVPHVIHMDRINAAFESRATYYSGFILSTVWQVTWRRRLCCAGAASCAPSTERFAAGIELREAGKRTYAFPYQIVEQSLGRRKSRSWAKRELRSTRHAQLVGATKLSGYLVRVFAIHVMIL